MARGGPRVGTPGTAYAQRTDLNQPVRTAPSTGYGTRVANERAQQAQPLPQTPEIHPSVQALMQPQPGPPPPDAPALFRPTENPNQPVQAGLGPAAGPSDFDLLRALKEQFPTAGMAELFQSMGYG